MKSEEIVYYMEYMTIALNRYMEEAEQGVCTGRKTAGGKIGR
jgi:hypothetical protein